MRPVLPQWLIEKKRDGGVLAEDEIRWFIAGFTRGDIPDYQMAALAMAIFFRGMSPAETAVLTDAMMRSGDVVDTSALRRPKIDKHSTGGIGDKVSLILAPLVACFDVAVPMISGRGLGITGGTLDKLESIPGYRTDLLEREFLGVLQACGCCIIGQTGQLAPADKKLYALRDVTGTVPSIPLITASIMSKKLAEGIDGLVLDVKCGRGAFMKTRPQARALARSMVRVGRAMGKKMSALITDMNQPLGRCAGNALEVVESIQTLRGQGPADLTDLTVALAVEMLRLAGRKQAPAALAKEMRRALADGRAFAKFVEMVKLQGGDTVAIKDPSKLPVARIVEPVGAPRRGVVRGVDADGIGRACLELGAGRTKTTDRVDFAVGVSGLRKIGERVQRGEALAMIHANDRACADAARIRIERAFTFAATAVKPPRLLLERIP